jgi:phosphoenolpyruvate phosphomutase
MEDRPFQKLKKMLTVPGLSFLMEAHNGLSAKIVEKAGFKGIWASGLSISTSMGLRDANEASWTQVLEILELMADSVSIPILADCDTGYGNFNNVRRLVKKLCEKKIAGACIEDKVFPKTNSLLDHSQTLVNVEEFCGKIKAAKDSQTEPEFNVVARVEALIAGLGIEEALYRAHRYYEAGADAILIHSKKETADEILEFAKQCSSDIPLVIVPTKYYKTPTHLFEEANIKVIIWANHNMRACVQSMENICKIIQQDKNLLRAESSVASLKDIFDLVNQEELDFAEQKYLPGEMKISV